VAATLACAGCGFPFLGKSDKHPPATPSVQKEAALAADPAGVPHRIIADPVALRMRVYQLTLPLGTLSLNDKIWRQLDEDALDSATTVLLARNGLRAGVAPQVRWPVLAKMLDTPGATSQEYVCQTDGRTPVVIPTRPNVPEQTVFYVDSDLELQGRTFDRCDNVVRLSMSRLKDTTDMLVQVEPVVLTGAIEVTRGAQEMGVVRMTQPQEQTFRNLRLVTHVAAANFLVLAPLNPKQNSFSVGTRFLSDTDKVPPMETVLVFVPIKQ